MFLSVYNLLSIPYVSYCVLSEYCRCAVDGCVHHRCKCRKAGIICADECECLCNGYRKVDGILYKPNGLRGTNIGDTPRINTDDDDDEEEE